MAKLEELLAPVKHYGMIWTTNWGREKPGEDWEPYWCPAEAHKKTKYRDGLIEFDDNKDEVQKAIEELQQVFPRKQFKMVEINETWTEIQ